MKMNRKELAELLGAEFSNGWLNVRGPGHSKDDRSLGIRFHRPAPGGFRVHSFAGDDLGECRAYVKKLLAEIASNGSIPLNLEDDAVQHTKADAPAGALRIWNEAQPIAGTPAGAYLVSRNCAPFEGEPWPADLRFHPACPFRTFKFPALVALVRDAVTGEPTGIHRIALKDDGAGKREMPDGMSPKMMMGRAKHAAVQLHPRGSQLGLAEGIETALSGHWIFKMPVWAAMSAGGIREFPIVYGIKFLRIFADHDEAGLSAARICKRRHEAAGIEVEVRYPPEFGSDWNDYLEKEY
jgi:hypothetical protein